MKKALEFEHQFETQENLEPQFETQEKSKNDLDLMVEVKPLFPSASKSEVHSISWVKVNSNWYDWGDDDSK